MDKKLKKLSIIPFLSSFVAFVWLSFKVLKRELKKILDTLDHKDINELPQFKGISPSSEILAKYIYEEMKKTFPQISKVGVWENDNSCSMFYEI